MNIRQLTRSVLILTLLLAVASGGYAQGPEGDAQPPAPGIDVGSSKFQELERSPLAVEADLGAGFYYQGVLTENGIPVSGSRQMEFKLWDAASAGAQVGATLTPTVAISKGQFSVELSWPGYLDGRALWLGVRAQDAGGVWRDLGRTSILAVPYAMSLMPGATITARGPTFAIQASGAATDAIRAYTTSTSGSDGAVYAGATASTGSAKGGYFFSYQGIGVYGASDTVEGVYGYSSNHDGVTGRSVVAGRSGVYGSSVNGYGVSGYAGSTSGTPIGVSGYAPSNGYAGYFGGRAHVSGTLTKGGGAFKIDHPLDPENKYLYHSFVESPDMKNLYDGVVTLDANGEAWVTLPAWFEALNKDFRYQLTAVGAPGPNLYVAQEISENRFQIAGGTAGAKVSWQVTGIRHDPWADANRIPVEENKPPEDVGTYLHPEAYGQPESKGADYEMLRAMQEDALQTDHVAP